MLYCPRCDKRITPDHRCLNRRHFFGMLAGAAALLVAPKPEPRPEVVAYIQRNLNRAMNVLRAGDSLSVTFSGTTSVPPYLSIVPCANPTARMSIEVDTNGGGASFIADQDYLVERVTYSTAYGRSNVPLTIKRSGE